MPNREKQLVVGLGEVLWDLLPEGKKFGGAAANFAYHAKAMGAEAVVVSCVGDDELGREILEQLDQINERANRVACHVCSRSGATPEIPEELAEFP